MSSNINRSLKSPCCDMGFFYVIMKASPSWLVLRGEK